MRLRAPERLRRRYGRVAVRLHAGRGLCPPVGYCQVAKREARPTQTSGRRSGSCKRARCTRAHDVSQTFCRGGNAPHFGMTPGRRWRRGAGMEPAESPRIAFPSSLTVYDKSTIHSSHVGCTHRAAHRAPRPPDTDTDRQVYNCNRSRHRATALHPILQSRTQARASTHSARGRNLHPAHFYTPPSYSPHTHASPRLNSRRPRARIASPSAARHVGADASAIRTPRVGPSCAYCTPCTALMGSLHSRT